MNLEEDPSPDLDSLAKCINDQESLARTFLSVEALDPSNPRSRNIFKFNDDGPANRLSPVRVTRIESTDKADDIPGVICATYVNLLTGPVRVAVSRNAATNSSPQVINTANVALVQTKKSLEAIKATSPASRQDLVLIVACALLAFVIMISAGGWKFESLAFDPKLNQNLPNVLTTLLVVSLFVERVIEVFVSAWSDSKVDQHEQNRDYWKSRQAELKNDVSVLLSELNGANPPNAERQAVINSLLSSKRAAIEDAGLNADIESKALLPFEARTRRISTWIGLVVGMLVSAVGFRFLGQIVSVATDTSQYPYFIAADVLLTGAVLAGGSKLVHQIFSLYESFMNATQDKLTNKSVAAK
jgi:hypothetical protein